MTQKVYQAFDSKATEMMVGDRATFTSDSGRYGTAKVIKIFAKNRIYARDEKSSMTLSISASSLVKI